MIITKTFDTVEQVTTVLPLGAGQTAEVIVTNTGGHTFSVMLEQESEGNGGTRTVATYATNTVSSLYANDSPNAVRLRLRCAVIDKVPDADTIAVTLQDTIPSQAVAIVCTAPAKAGATSGWVVGAADDLGKVATLPASKTASTLVMRLPRLKVGDRLVGFYLLGSLQSAGNAATILGDIRSLTAITSGSTDASVAVMGAALSVTANTIVSKANTQVKNVDHVVVEGESLYALVTSTTGASCTQELLGVVLNVIPAPSFG